MEWFHSWCSPCWEAQHKVPGCSFPCTRWEPAMWLTLSASTQENKATRRGSFPFRNGQTGCNPRDDYTDPWSTSLASYLLDGLPVSGIAEDKWDCWENKLLGFFFSFFFVKGCGVGFGFGLILFLLYQFPNFSIPETTRGGWLIVQLWIRKIVWNC